MENKEFKFRGWVARDDISERYGPHTSLFRSKPRHAPEYKKEFECEWQDSLNGSFGMATYDLSKMFPDLKWEDGPIPVEITIRPIELPQMATGDNAVWVARDLNGELYSFKDRPQRNFYEKMWVEGSAKSVIFQSKKYDKSLFLAKIGDSLFPYLTWEDEPIKVEL